MQHYARRRALSCALATALTACTVAQGSMRYDLVAASRLQALGTAAGTTFAILGPPAMNAAGQVAFNATLNNSSASNDSGMWVNDALVARAGDAAPGEVPGLRFRVFSYTDTPVINDAGMVAFSTRPSIPGVAFASNDMAIWAGQPESLELVAMAGRTAPDLSPGARYRFGVESGGGIFPSQSPGRPLLTEGGQIVFWAEVDDEGGRHHAIYAGYPSSPGLVVRGHRQAHDLPAGTNHGIFGQNPLMDGVGNILVHSILEGAGVTLSVDGHALYNGSPAEFRLLRRQNQAIDNLPGARWGDPGLRGMLNEAGQTFFINELRGVPPGTTSTLWFAEPAGTPWLLARAGDPAPGVPGVPV